jgi:CheY-like chemotaxis protein
MGWDRSHQSLERFRNYCGLIKFARSGFPWEKTTKGDVASVYTNCETAINAAENLHTAKKRPMTRRILIIDDEDDIRQVAAMSLETIAGWDVILANSGKQGIERASKEQPDAILLDVMMPEMDGPTTLLKLKANGQTSHIPVLLLTAKVHGSDQRRFAEMGVAAILFKPFDPLTLARQISTALGWREDG